MADTDVKKPKEPPKPVQIGGESLVDRIIPHLKKIIIGVIILAVVLSVIFFIRWWKHRGEEKNTTKLASVFAVAQRPVAPPAAPGATPDPTTFPDHKSRAKAVLDEIAKQGTELSHSYRGGLLLDAGQIDDAIAEYKLGQADPGLEGVLSREGLGIALEGKAAAEKDGAARQKLLEEALATFQKMQPDAKGPRHPYALYHQGRLFQLLGKSAEAKTSFEKASEMLPEQHELKDHLTKRLASLGAA